MCCQRVSVTTVCLFALFVTALLIDGAGGHGSVTFPRPRQALDAATRFGAACPNPSANTSTNTEGMMGNGQACYWFSHGCSIGCPACDGTVGSPGHDDATSPKFLYSRTVA